MGHATLMTTFYLVRHGTNDFIGRGLAGRTPGVHLNEKGRKEALSAAKTLSDVDISQIFSSPLERAMETAQPLSELLGLPIQISDEITEVDFGEWNGAGQHELNKSRDWTLFSKER